jgi:hypothetical protein
MCAPWNFPVFLADWQASESRLMAKGVVTLRLLI